MLAQITEALRRGDTAAALATARTAVAAEPDNAHAQHLLGLSAQRAGDTATARYLEGSRLEAIYPLSPLMQYSALSVDCVSYAGTLNIGFTGARDTLPHLQRLAVYAGRAVEELEQLLGVREKRA